MPPIDRLSALDCAFLDLDSATAPLHVGWTILVDGRAPSVSALRRHVEGRLEHVPRFRRRVARPRLGLGDPYWADDAGFDIARHVHAVTLAPPAGPAELRELAGRLLSSSLDAEHPLWRMYLVGGLRGGGWAVVGQAHHALVDGIAAVEVAMLLFDAAGHAPAPSRPARWSPAAQPSAPAAVAAFARDRLTGAARAARATAATVGHGSDVPGAMRQLAAPAAATALDRSATHRRAMGLGITSLDGAREVGRRHGATINDVLLAAATVALGRALRRRGERPAAVKALVPVNVRRRGDAGAMGNRISFVTVSLPVAMSDPIAVLRRVAGEMRARKAGGGAAPLEALSEVAELLPGGARRVVARTAARAASFNVVVSNVPGPPVELELLGRRVSAVFPAVPFLRGHALSIGALSYRGRLHCGVYADAAVVPDAAEVARDLEAAFDALRIVPRGPDTPWRARAVSRRQRAAKR
ncbi:MAG: wax ester/triacylglycerol synthase family O-acyltransferase [Solirubrobacteraceae bacterium]